MSVSLCVHVCMCVSAPLLLGGQGAVPRDEALVLVLVLFVMVEERRIEEELEGG